MSAPFSNTHLRVPPGFANILWCFSREVLRVQPPDIPSFGMEYFDHLLRVRLETGEEDIAKLGAIIDDRYYNNRSFMPPETEETIDIDLNDPEVEKAAVKIQSHFSKLKKARESKPSDKVSAGPQPE
ncbi:Sperm surface protein Sp17 [Taenia solium]|eukprot:TsM_000340900 transcript=TsM_000340900 gene=TsM_000340900